MGRTRRHNEPAKVVERDDRRIGGAQYRVLRNLTNLDSKRIEVLRRAAYKDLCAEKITSASELYKKWSAVISTGHEHYKKHQKNDPDIANRVLGLAVAFAAISRTDNQTHFTQPELKKALKSYSPHRDDTQLRVPVDTAKAALKATTRANVEAKADDAANGREDQRVPTVETVRKQASKVLSILRDVSFGDKEALARAAATMVKSQDYINEHSFVRATSDAFKVLQSESNKTNLKVAIMYAHIAQGYKFDDAAERFNALGKNEQAEARLVEQALIDQNLDRSHFADEACALNIQATCDVAVKVKAVGYSLAASRLQPVNDELARLAASRLSEAL